VTIGIVGLPSLFGTPHCRDAGHWPEQAAHGRSILAAAFSRGHPLDADRFLCHQKIAAFACNHFWVG
jgi:hypothetical protein